MTTLIALLQFVEIYIISDFLTHDARENLKKRKFWVFFLTLAFIYWDIMLHLPSPFPYYPLSTWCAFGLSFALTKRKEFLENIATILLFFFTQTIAIIFDRVIRDLVSVDLFDDYVTLFFLFLFIAVFWLIRLKSNWFFSLLSIREKLLYNFVFLMLSTLFPLLFYKRIAQSISIYYLILFFSLSVGITLLVYNSRLNISERKRKIGDKLIEQQKNYYANLLIKDQQFLKLKHDLKHQFFHLDYLLKQKDYDKLETSLSQLSGDYSKITTAKTGNELLDLQIDWARQRYSPEIVLEVSGVLPPNFPMDSSDFCVLFGNLLDNAFEATHRAKNINPNMTFQIIDKKEELIFKFITPQLREIEFKDGLPLSRKSDLGHGIGTLSIAEIVKRHQGTLQYICQDRLMSIEVKIPVLKKEPTA